MTFLVLFKEKFRRKSTQKKIKIVLHAGLEKTGTSALQNFFANNAKNLEKQGVLYPNVTAEQKGYIPTSGNGAGILDQYKKNSKLFEKIYNKAAQRNCHTIILSSEIMTKDPELLYEILQTHQNLDPYVILYVRELYSFSWTYYQQDLKYAEGEYREYDQIVPPLNLDIWLDSSFSKEGRLILSNFDFFKKDLITSFFKKLLIPINLRPLKGIKMINRSCTESEHNILDKLWRKRMGHLASRIFNAFLLSKSNGNILKYYNPEFSKRIYTHYKKTIDKANILLSDKEKLEILPKQPIDYTTSWDRNKIDPEDVRKVIEVLNKNEVFENSPFKSLCPEKFNLFEYLSANIDLLMDGLDPYRHWYETTKEGVNQDGQ